jgi:hypothetical protein
MGENTKFIQTDRSQVALHEYLINDLKERFPGFKVIANQPLDHGLRVDYALIKSDKQDLKVLVEVKLRRPTPEDIMRISFYRTMLNEKKDQRIKILLYSPVFPSKVRQLARIADVELVDLPEHFFEATGSTKHIKITSEKAWSVITQILKRGRLSIRQTSIRSGTSFGWTHAIFTQLQRSGILERQGNAYVLVDLPRLLDGIAWERPLSSLIVKEWTAPTSSLDETVEDIRIADKDAIFTGYHAAEGISEYSRRTDIVQVYALHAEHIERQVGTSDKGIKVQVLWPDRCILVTQGHGTSKDRLLTVTEDQLLLDLAGLGIPARDILTKILDRYRGRPNE